MKPITSPPVASNKMEQEMQNIEVFERGSVEDACKLLAERVKKARIAQGKTQSEFADKANIPIRTYKRFELTGQTNLENFIMIMRAMECARYLNTVFPSFVFDKKTYEEAFILETTSGEKVKIRGGILSQNKNTFDDALMRSLEDLKKRLDSYKQKIDDFGSKPTGKSDEEKDRGG